MESLSTCYVDIYLNDDSNLIEQSKLNEAELKGVEISKTVYVNNRYYGIESLAFNFENKTLQVFVKE